MSDEPTLFDDFDDTPTNFGEVPMPGVYRDRTFEEYASWKAINSGCVKWGRVSPKHMQAAVEGRVKNEDTKDRKLGRAIHARLLEPDSFHERFRIAKPCCAVLKSGANKGEVCGKASSHVADDGQWYCGVHKTVEMLKPTDSVSAEEYARCNKIANALHEHWAMPLFKREGWCEVSIAWEWQGLTLKGRLDKFSEGKRPTIIDIKKCRVGAGKREDCQKSILNYGYHRQAAMYVNGVKALTGCVPEFVWLFVEDNEPFDINVIPATQEDIEIGWQEVTTVLDTFKRQSEASDMFGYLWKPINIKPGGLPLWFLKQTRELKG